MITATIFEAKTGLSALIKKAQNGETVVITSGKERTPVARLEAIDSKRRNFLRKGDTWLRVELGFLGATS